MTTIVGTEQYFASVTSQTITVPTGVTSGMTGIFVFSTANNSVVGFTLTKSGATFTDIDERNATNMRVGIIKGTGLTAGDSISLTCSGTSNASSFYSFYTDQFDVNVSSVSAAIRGASSAVNTTGALTPVVGQTCLIISNERTTATPTTISSSVSSGGESITQIGFVEDNTPATTTYFATFVAAAATSHTATITYNSASTNGYAALLTTTQVASGSFASATDGAGTGVASDATVTIIGAPVTNAAVASASATGVANDIHALHSPLKEWIQNQGNMYVAHRGGNADFVEMTANAYAQCDALKVQALEISVWRTSDGVWVGSHDQSTLRMFGVDLDIPTNTYATLAALRTTVGSYPIAKMTDLLDLYANSNHILFIENKPGTNAPEFISILNGYTNSTGTIVVKGYYSGTVVQAAARLAGYTTWGYYYEADLTNLDTSYTRWDLLGLNFDASSSAWTQILAKQKLTLAHVCLTLADVATAWSKGANGVLTAKVLGVIPQAPQTPPTPLALAYDATALVSSNAPTTDSPIGVGFAYDAAGPQTSQVTAHAQELEVFAQAFDATAHIVTVLYLTTPTYKQRFIGHPLWNRVSFDVGYSLFRFGNSYQLLIDPDTNQIESADRAFIGGRIYAIDNAEAARLRDAGYGKWVSLTPDTPIPDIDYSQYGTGIYGQGPYGE